MQPLYGNWLDGEWAYTGMLAQSRQGISAEAPLVRGKPQTAEDGYVRDPGRGGDIYTKGAWTLHTLRNPRGRASCRGRGESVRVDRGGRRIIKTKKDTKR